MQLVKDYTLEQARSKIEYYLGLTPKEETVFSGTDRPSESCISILQDSQFPDSRLL